MAVSSSVSILRDIQTLFDSGTAGALSDRQLLEQFTSKREGSGEAAFEALVSRHGPMVLRVCRNVLGDSTDAQDAFQATFLVLVKRAGSIRRLESVGSWLYGVACRVAARARVESSRRRVAERQGALRVVTAASSPDSEGAIEEQFGPVIQEEVRRLPEKYRAVVALCYWQGLTHEQAAAQLGCPLGTVRSRIARARDILRRRLSKRGLESLAEGMLSIIPSTSFSRLAIVPKALTSATVAAAVKVVSGGALTEATSITVAGLTQNVLRSLLMLKIKTIAFSLMIIGIGAYGASLAAPQAEQRNPRNPPGRDGSLKASRSKQQPPVVVQESYIVEPPDVLNVEVLEALPGRPITGERSVRPDGKISLGFYGDLYVAGLTLPEIKEKLIRLLQQYLSDESLGIVEIDESNKARIDHKTEQPVTIDPKKSLTVLVDLAKSNSKWCYIQGEVLVPGRIALTGRETVLDAVNLAGGISPAAKRGDVVLYRQRQSGEPLAAMPIDIDQIMMGDDLSTNYQLKPGDRLVIPRQPGVVAHFTEQSTPAAAGQEGAARIPNRPSEKSDATPETRAPRRTDRPQAPSREAVTLYDVQNRLKDVERKLDTILQLLTPKAP